LILLEASSPNAGKSPLPSTIHLLMERDKDIIISDAEERRGGDWPFIKSPKSAGITGDRDRVDRGCAQQGHHECIQARAAENPKIMNNEWKMESQASGYWGRLAER